MTARATVALEKAKRLEPDKTSIREALGRAYFRSARFEQAAEEFAAVVERHPVNDYAHFCLGRALANYRFAVQHTSLDVEPDRALASRAHTAMARILAFLDRREEALKEFDAAIQLGDVPGGAYKDALAGKSRLQQPPL